MALQIGGSTAAIELADIVSNLSHVIPISNVERQLRREKAARLMQMHGIAALVLTASSSLYYFTGLSWHQNERLLGAVLTRDGELIFISPAFEESKVRETVGNRVQVRLWEEEACPYSLVKEILQSEGLQNGTIALDEVAPFFMVENLRHAMPERQIISGKLITAECRMHKSSSELALMQAAKNITLEVQRRAARILREGISSFEVANFINLAHQAFGGSSSSFCIVSFGLPTSIPHGPDGIQYLKEGDMVLIDAGCKIENYNSDITRSYVFGQATRRQRSMWELEKAAQAAVFDAAQLGVPCEDVDAAARRVIEAAGRDEKSTTPRLPHRTGHGIGLDIHEWTYLVKGNKTALATGMCFSNEPMICVEGEFGVRLEDHFYMTERGPHWFTEPSISIDQPFPV